MENSNEIEYMPSQQLLELVVANKGRPDPQLNVMLSALAEGKVPETRVAKWLRSCRGNVLHLGKKAERFVYTFLGTISWLKSVECQKEYFKFVTNIISAFPSLYTEPTLKILIGLFTSVPPDEGNLIHCLIREIMAIVPLSKSIILRQVDFQFPYVKIDSQKQANYVGNILELMEMDDTWKGKMLEIMLSKILVLDENIPRDEIMDSEDDQEDEGDEGVFGMEVEEEEENKKEVCEESMKNPMAESLDRVLYLVFSYIQWNFERTKCEEEEQEEKENKSQCVERTGDSERARSISEHLLSSFSSVILMSHCSSHTQFTVFYMSAMDEGFRDRLLQVLWETVQSPSRLPAVRENAASYIGSLLARAVFIDKRTCLLWMGRISSRLHKYLKTHTNGDVDTTIHGTFYALCQTLFYVFAFRHKELVSTKESLAYIQRFDFQALVGSRLNPLKVVNPAVVSKFASVTRTYQICYCYTYIERNERRMFPTIRLRDGKLERIELRVLPSFFPFDPYLLKRTSCFVKPFYREYQGDDNDESLIKPEAPDADDEDDFLDDKVKKEDEHMSTSWTDIFGYSRSPGFKISVSEHL